MKIMMSGVGGMLGVAFYREFVSLGYDVHGSDIDDNETWLSKLDFRNFDEYKKIAQGFKPEMLFHIGAHTGLEFCERNVDDAYKTNTLSVENAVIIANGLDIPILYISTAGIFDGTQNVYDDWAVPNPLGIYARSKYLGERYVLENARRKFVCRAGWMMGGGPKKDKKFISKIMSQLKGGARELFIVDDKEGTPTYTVDFARCCAKLIETEYFGLYNMVCSGMTSRLDVTRELVSILGLTSSIEVKPVGSDHFKGEYFAPRPASERLVNTKLQLRGLDNMRDWRDCLKEYLEQDYSNFL